MVVICCCWVAILLLLMVVICCGLEVVGAPDCCGRPILAIGY